jgi:hypothetical protein
MPYNNDNFGDIQRALVRSVYTQHFEHYEPVPPPLAYHLLDDSGDNLIDDSGDYLVVT